MKHYVGYGTVGHLFTDEESDAAKTYAIARMIFDGGFSRCEYESWMREFLSEDFTYDYKNYKDSGYYEEVVLWFPDFQYDFRGALELFEKECAEFCAESIDDDGDNE